MCTGNYGNNYLQVVRFKRPLLQRLISLIINFEHCVTWYLNEMPMTEKNELIEKSPEYFIVPEISKGIYDFC